MNLLLPKCVTTPHITEASLLCFLRHFCWSSFAASIIHWASDRLACEKKLKPWVSEAEQGWLKVMLWRQSTMSAGRNNHEITRTVPWADLLSAGVSLSHTGYFNSNDVTQAKIKLCFLVCLQGQSSLNPKGTGFPSHGASLALRVLCGAGEHLQRLGARALLDGGQGQGAGALPDGRVSTGWWEETWQVRWRCSD